MSKRQLHREEAIKLITPVVDGEAAEEASRAFFQYIEKDAEVNWYFEEEKSVKSILRQKLPRYQAPSHLRRRIKLLLRRFHKGNVDQTIIGN